MSGMFHKFLNKRLPCHISHIPLKLKRFSKAFVFEFFNNDANTNYKQPLVIGVK